MILHIDRRWHFWHRQCFMCPSAPLGLAISDPVDWLTRQTYGWTMKIISDNDTFPPSRNYKSLYVHRSARASRDLRPHSLILASCKPGRKPGFRPGLRPGLRQGAAKLLHQSRHVEIDAAGSLVYARARQMECRKNPSRASQRTCWSWIFVTYFIIRAYRDVIKRENAMKKLDFTSKTL